MSEIINAIILGIVQGLTEFLPVSSSGHLEIMKHLIGNNALSEQSLLTTVFLHFATAMATIFVFRNDILDIIKSILKKDGDSQRFFVLAIVVSMIPAALIGVFFDDIIESFFDGQLLLVGAMLLVTGLLLYTSEKIKPAKQNLDLKKAFIIGISQAVAILPGISRSGSTIATSLLLGIEKDKAARFSFLMVIPLIFGKMAKDLISGDFAQHMPSTLFLITGFIAAFISGILACLFMIKLVRNTKLIYFAIYCFVIGSAVSIYSLI